VNYLTNCREIALVGIKNQNPHSIVSTTTELLVPTGENRFHPTQKSLLLFEELIKKHSNENDVVLILSWVLVLLRLRVRTPNEDLEDASCQRNTLIKLKN
jgi:hypothetical protein